ncbi:MAG: MBL fold metallo-hydrolase [Evtepia sp.]|uniref:MBL fold metallo-hydrolase n=1 Tax=Evtepia sp. TaxID=2773933 RepID=UPI002A75D719|nr:MBL fold metallo-hydrolase [Evtepia sp.]MDY3015193.1 MBL fold metallo-hydrolase [Evtepia sp.]
MEQLTLRWHGHACFALTCRDFTVVFDPYEDNYVPGFSPLDVQADLVLCSHQHGDHGAAHVVKPRTGHQNPFQITTIETFHDPEGGALRGNNTIHILQAGSLRLAHFGDLGCELAPAQLAELSGLDVALIPVGGFYTIGPEEAKALIDTIRPKVVVPMHYRMGDVGLPTVAELEEFLAQIGGDYVYYPGDTITINEGTKPQVAVLTYKG